MDDFGGPDPADDGASYAQLIQDNGRDWISNFTHCLAPRPADEGRFRSKNDIVARYPTMSLRRFGRRRSRGDVPTLIVTPVAVHDSGFVDLMRGHSLVDLLCASSQVYLTDWVSATADMGQLSIDAYLAELNAAIDDIGGQANVVGLCQGGWLSLILAARFPGKIRKLVLAGTPVDTGARASLMTRFARKAIECGELPEDGTVNGAQWLAPLGAAQGHERAAIETMQRNPASFARADLTAISVYEDWARRSIDIPGRLARETLTRIFARNELARGEFVALGRKIDLSCVKAPLFVLAGACDEITPKQQALPVMQAVGTPKARTRSLVAPCGHFALFVGAGVLAREWRTIAGWLSSSPAPGKRRAHAS